MLSFPFINCSTLHDLNQYNYVIHLSIHDIVDGLKLEKKTHQKNMSTRIKRGSRRVSQHPAKDTIQVTLKKATHIYRL
jgi:hypothetical protein